MMDGLMRSMDSQALMDYLSARQWSQNERIAAVAAPFHAAAVAVLAQFSETTLGRPEMDQCLRKLLEAQDWAIRYAMRHGTGEGVEG